MQPKVDLYNSAYGNYEAEVYRQIRVETYGNDLGQTSWVTAEESAEIPKMLELNRDSYVLEIGCGSGRYALHLASEIGCKVIDRKSTRLNSSHGYISYAVFCLKKKK